jgi:hypothetical protein
LTGELPFEGMRGGFPIILKIQEAFGDGVEIRKIIGCEDLALDNGEVDFDLVEPTGMDRGHARASSGGRDGGDAERL